MRFVCTRSSKTGDREAIDLYLSEADAERALEAYLRDEPDWNGLLHVVAVEFEAYESPN